MQISEPAEYVILGLLKIQPMHGYEMFQQFENGTPGQIVHLEMSQMYAFCKKLERLAYISSQLEPQGSRPPRKIFQLTEAGHDVFLKWLTQPVEKPRDIRLLFLVKLYFVRYFLPDQTMHLIELQIQACQRFLVHLQNLQSQHTVATSVTDVADRKREDERFFEHVVLRSRIHQTLSLLDWMQELRSEMSQ